MTRTCVICRRPLPTRWWHFFVRAIPLCPPKLIGSCDREFNRRVDGLHL